MKKAAQAVLNALAFPDGELSILIVDDTAIEALNRQYLNRSGPTNVMAFAMREGPFGELNPRMLGDVVLSVDTARTEAEQMGISTEERITQLLVHGILHLLGYDHEASKDDALRMERQSDALLDMIKGLDV